MRKVPVVRRVLCALLAVAMIFSCVLGAYADSTFETFTGDSSRNITAVEINATGGGEIEYDVAGDAGVSTTGYSATAVPIGSVCTATAIGSQAHPFLYWKDNYSGRIFSYREMIRFTTSTKVGFTAVFCNAQSNQHWVQYVNYGGNLLQSNGYLQMGVEPSPPLNPSVPGFTFTGWSVTPSEVAAEEGNVFVTPNFTVNNESYTVTITNDAYVSGAGTYSNYQTVNLAAEEKDGSGQTFSYWKTADGEIVSYDRNYSFRINYNVTLTAVYGETVTPRPIIRVTKIVRDPDGMRITYFAERSVPEGYTVVTHGMLMSAKATVKDGQMRVSIPTDTPTSTVRKVCGTSNENCGTFSLTKTSVNASTTVTARAYLICMDASGTESILYSDIIRSTLADA